MGLIGKILQPIIKNGLRQIQTEIYKNYIKSGYQVLPPGMDSVPIADDQGIIIMIDQTEGKTVSIGVYPDPQAETGEVRFYSRDDDGIEQSFLWIKKDGTIEINGSADNAVSFADLETALNNFKTSIDSAIAGSITGHVHPVTTAPGTTGPGAGSAPSTSIDISGSKVDTVKLP